MGNIITPVLPHDLPENWNDTQYVSPGGTEVGLTEKHGYNYLMKQVNNSQKAINELDAEMAETNTLLAKKYSPDNKPTPEDLGAARDTDTMVIRLVNIDGKPIRELSCGVYRLMGGNYPWKPGWCSGWGILDVKRLPSSDWGTIYLSDTVNKRYAEGSVNWNTGEIRWDELATTYYAVDKAGDTMTGALGINNGHMLIEGNAQGGAVWFRSAKDDLNNSGAVAHYHGLGVDQALKYERWTNGSVVQYSILHTRNKPYGFYTGNAAARELSIGGLGRALVLFSQYGVGIVNAYNAAFIGTDSTSRYFYNETIRYGYGTDNGLLEILSNDPANKFFNENGCQYHYQVL